MAMGQGIFSPRGFLMAGGIVLVLLGVVGYLGIFSESAFPSFWLDNGENVAHLALGIVALAALYVPGLNSALAPYYRWIVLLVGVIALFFAIDLVAARLRPHEVGFREAVVLSVLYTLLAVDLVVAAWAFLAGWKSEPAMA